MLLDQNTNAYNATEQKNNKTTYIATKTIGCVYGHAIKKIVNHYRVHVIQRLEGDVCSSILFLPVASGGGG